MKPTKEIIELAKRLHELGYRREIGELDWFIPKDKNHVRPCITVYSKLRKGWIADHFESHLAKDCTPIPSLGDGLEWLNEHSNTRGIQWAVMLLNNVSTNNKWSCHFNPDIGKYCEADTPREAVFKAMIKVLEK